MIRIAERQAKKSTFDRARVGAVITKKKCLVSYAHNAIRCYRDPKGFILPRKVEHTLHAEQAAIIKALNAGLQSDLVGSYLYVTRIKKDGTKALALPCVTCQELIRAVGIKRVFYTTDKGISKYDV
jgi:deoxycytidylate deaminase